MNLIIIIIALYSPFVRVCVIKHVRESTHALDRDTGGVKAGLFSHYMYRRFSLQFGVEGAETTYSLVPHQTLLRRKVKPSVVLIKLVRDSILEQASGYLFFKPSRAVRLCANKK